MEKKKLNHDDYTVAWICPLEVEQVAALEMLDEEHQRLPQPENDHNAYNLGSVFNHNVVIAGLPTTGNCSAATVVAQMRNTYPRLRFGLLVGIGGGVPTHTDAGPIRLGHIVVSQPVGQHSGAVQYDHGKAEVNDFVRTGFLAPPPMVLLNAARELQVSRRRASVDPLISHLERIDTTKLGLRNFKRPKADQDHLYEPEYIHLEKGKSCKRCGCDASKRVDRDVDDSDDGSTSETDDNRLVIHRGTIASGEVVMRDGLHRDALARDHKILCFEMEAAGALNDFPCLVIRGISDYSDSHKNDRWHGFAAAVAAAYARELFQHMPVEEVKKCRITETGSWFLENDRYKWLKDNSGTHLWLQGFPGCGKTVLASTIIEDLTTDSHLKGVVIYFFFTFSDESKQSLGHMLRSLIYQLTRQYDSTKPHLIGLFNSCGKGNKQPKTEELIEVFDQMTLPNDLNETYDRILHKIPDNRVPTAIKLLQFLVFSKRPLRLEEVIDAVATESDIKPPCNAVVTELEIESPFDAENRVSPPDAITAYCPNLVKITTTRKSNFPDMSNEDGDQMVKTIQLAHFSVREYLLLGRKENPFCYFFEKKVANGAITRILLAYLWTAAKPENSPRVRWHLPELPLHELATKYWMQHAATSDESEESTLAWTRKFFTSSSFLQYWKQRYSWYDGNDFDVDPTLLHFALHYASRFGLRRSSEYLLSMGADPNAQGGKYGNPLQAASTSGNVETVQVLLDHGASVNAKGGCYGSALHAAAWYGHVNTLQLLLKYGADIGALDWECGSAATDPDCEEGSAPPALQVAAYNGHTEVVKALLMHGADVNARNTKTSHLDDDMYYNYATCHYTALETACYMGHIEVVKILLENNAEIDARRPCSRRDSRLYATLGGDWGKGTPLQAASSRGHLKIVRILAESGANVNIRSGSDGYALHAALSEARTEVSLFLIASGADIQATGGRHGTTLWAAAYGRDVAMVRLLIGIGARTDHPNPIGKSAVILACEAGSVQVAKLLLDISAEVNAQGGKHDTALYATLQSGYDKITEIAQVLLDKGTDPNGHNEGDDTLLYRETDMAVNLMDKSAVTMLLAYGADPNVQGGEFGTALAVASYRGSRELVQMLLDNGADVNSQGGWYGNALQSACASRSYVKYLIQDLLHDGASINAQGGAYGTALCAASSKGDLEMIKLLVREGADVNGPGGRYYGCALCAAAYKGHIDIVRVLLNEGASINVQGGKYGTALCAASSAGKLEIVRLLLREGADINAPGVVYDCALCAAAYKGHIDVVRALLENGAVAGTSTNPYDFALQVAIERGNKDIAKLLFEEGALKELTIDRANSHPGLKRSASTSSMWWSAEESSRDSRDAITQAWEIRRNSFHLLDDAAWSQYSG
ncbi:ankyrin repeat protein [Aureobasidium sp. EXF-3400]|nr:ankyrin repeat protein [Aureobasidium sp. EXF-3400]